MHIWIVTTDNDNGTHAEGFAREEAALARFKELVTEEWLEWDEDPDAMPDDPYDAYEKLSCRPLYDNWIRCEAVEVQP